MLEPSQWFSEVVRDAGSAFSLRIREKLHEQQTPYQLIEVYATEGFGNLMVIDGCTMLSTRDNFLYHEMMSHPALFTHGAPKRVCIIGGGDCGTLKEVLKHPQVESAVQIDIDEAVTRLAERYFPELTASNSDPRAQLRFEDGVRWIQQADAGSLDLIIVDSTDPVGPAEGLFTKDFYAHCWRALDLGGILVQQSESPLYHMQILRDMHAEMQAAGFVASRTLFFPQAIYPSGWWSATMAGKEADLADFRAEDAERKPFETQYYNAEIHRAALAQPEFFRRQLAGS
ncbi:polyamine aminopropyltransferase [Thiorhodococcus mannitoliphagus]|uniref:Polyamine aminopropyltransferase n=1 Tax=Thiorhodococcus mannitoliphagus TaxID=329406 RepID=A0A6P1E5C4_9GAMM|nr:polyamine aminopropyltransferase [Thiorhodococcus mannitoliphagus]NEX23224.1 polyamine aminopropyltransferase [Thiorhodococcus mannitoliphagus]